MHRLISHRPFVLSLVAVCVLAWSGVARPAQAAAGGARAYLSQGTAQFTPTGFVGSGVATHLGAYTESGTITLTPTADPFVFDAVAEVTYTAANGTDTLKADIAGQLNFATGVIAATVTWDGGTGRFAAATGTATFAGQLTPEGTIAAAITGTISY